MPTEFEIAEFSCSNSIGEITLGGKITDKYRIISVSGLNGLPFQFNTTRNTDAQSVYLESTLAQPRIITFVFEVDNIPTEREYLMKVFNPLITDNMLIGNWNGNVKYIYYVAYPILIEQATTYSKMRCTVDLYCAEPFWISATGISSRVANIETLEIPSTKDEPVIFLHTLDFSIENLGDVIAPFSIYFRNNGASSCYNPKVQLMTTEKQPFMMAETDIIPGDDVTFNTYPDDLYVFKNKGDSGEEDLENSLPPEHEYFMCPIGISTVRCTVETNDATMIQILFSGSARYLGL